MSRVINPESAGKLRGQLVRSIVAASGELLRQPEPNIVSRDTAAFISLALFEVYNTIDVSVAAWEKRGYWVKADRFRLDWDWTKSTSERLRVALLAEDWGEIAQRVVFVLQKLGGVKPAIIRKNAPWVGAWERLRQS